MRFERSDIMYESPVTILFGEMKTQYEDECFKTVQSYGFDVNKEELTKALQYDREQYSKGYEDGYIRGIEELAERLRLKCLDNIYHEVWLHTILKIASELKGE